MNARRILVIVSTVILLGSFFAIFASGAFRPVQAGPVTLAKLENVRGYAAASTTNGVNYAIDGGKLYASDSAGWHLVFTPDGVIVGAVALRPQQSGGIYLGAANAAVVYTPSTGGQSWIKIPLVTQAVGGVTAIAADSTNQLVYVGTDTDGVYRLRDVGSSMIASGHLLLDEPVEEIVAAQGVAYIRTRWHLYRAEEMGLRWVVVENLPSPATALALSPTTPPTVYVGTANSGVRASQDGVNWQPVNNGLAFTPGTQLYVNSLAVDPAQPQVLYVATSLIFGSANAHVTPLGVWMSSNGAGSWGELAAINDVAVTELLPVSGQTGAVHALTQASRTPLALGSASPMTPPLTVVTAKVGRAPLTATPDMGMLGWLLTGLTGGFALLLLWEMRQRSHAVVPLGTGV